MEDVLLMSVIVKDMKMPTECGSCDFAGFLPYEDPYCRRLMRTIRVTSKRLDGCPLGAIPPHGRLKDADALLKKCEFVCTDDDEDIRAVRYSVIEEAATIIPAEEGEL